MSSRGMLTVVRASILGKLGAHNRAHAVAIALLYDLVPRDGLVRALAGVNVPTAA
jgi:hypothetical protein